MEGIFVKEKSMIPVHILDEGDVKNIPKPDWRFRLKIWQSEFLKRSGLTVVACSFLAVWTVSACAITGAIVKKNTTEEVTARVQSEMRQGFQQYLEQQAEAQRRDSFLTGEDSFEAAVQEIAVPLSQIIATYSQDYGVTQEGLNTIGWVFCARCAQSSSEFGKSPKEILEKDQAWEGKVVGHATRNQYLVLAEEISRDYLNGKYPDGYTIAQTFFSREAGGKIIARNEFKTGPHTIYWWYGK